MDRREFLRNGGVALPGSLAVVFAGCSAASEPGNEPTDSPTSTSTAEPTASSATDSAANSAAGIAANDGDYEVVENGVGIVQMSMDSLENAGGGDSIPMLTGVAENASDGPLASAQIIVTFYDQETELETARTKSVNDIRSGERWYWTAMYAGSNPGYVDRAVVDRIDAYA